MPKSKKTKTKTNTTEKKKRGRCSNCRKAGHNVRTCFTNPTRD